MKSKIHIVPSNGEWAIRMSGSPDPASTHATQQAAIEQAMEIAQDEATDIVIHRRNGSFRNVINFETIERRLAEARTAGSHLHRQIAWGLFAAGAVTALAVFLVLHPPEPARRLFN